VLFILIGYSGSRSSFQWPERGRFAVFMHFVSIIRLSGWTDGVYSCLSGVSSGFGGDCGLFVGFRPSEER